MTHPIQVQPVILCGGSGTRLWPLSRAGFPKQFLCLTGPESLFQQAAKRLMGLRGEGFQVGAPLVVTGEEHRFLASEQLREIGVTASAVLLEPWGRNTAPALTLAALAAIDNGDDPVLVVTPADQSIADAAAFAAAMQIAIREAATGSIVILGILPDRPETGYGYIKALKTQGSGLSKPPVLAVDRFVEKPDAATAKIYLDHGGYYWNAGMFVLKASVWLEVLGQFRLDILQTTQAAWKARSTDANPAAPFIRPGKAEFAAVPAQSIDYAVMEPLTGHSTPLVPQHSSLSTHPSALIPQHSLKMVLLDAGWSDLGTWDAVWQVLPKDEHGNAHLGDVLSTDSRNTLVHASSRLVSLVGVDNLIVIETPDAVLVAEMSRCQDVKKIVETLHTSSLSPQHPTLALRHRKVHRPWGWYDGIDEGDRFRVKRIQVKPGASLSLQMHHHRAEHWVVVRGTAEITCGNEKKLLTENQSTYIPVGEVHRLANPGTIPLEIIEVQSGSYLGEDDIVRFEDNYGRTKA